MHLLRAPGSVTLLELEKGFEKYFSHVFLIFFGEPGKQNVHLKPESNRLRLNR